MKRNILHTLWAAALLLTACTQEELPLPGADNAAPLAITITDGGYALTTSADGSQKAATRATEDGYRTEFTASDACGLYLVRNGAIVYDNVKLTATAGTNGSLTWQPEAGVTLAGGMAGEKYFLYYPYQETAKMAGKVNATDTTSDGDFFATLINDWQPEADQSDYTQGYTASDLMTATGSGSKADGKLSLSFSMTHRMALAVVEMPKTVYKFTDTSIPDYVIATTADFSGEAKPCRNTDGTYRYFVRPGQGNTVTLTGSYADGKKEFFITPNNISVSSYKTYKVDGAPTIDKDHNLQVGDYLLADGNIVGKDETLTEEQKASVIAIVFHAGHHENDASDYSATGIGQQKCHG
ncbi:fimbrillin family protein, partial [Bacteroides fragilis]